MKIRAQVSVLIAGIFVIFGLAAIMIGKLVLMPSFAELERADAPTAMRRIDHALGQTLEQVAVASMDWGNWSDTYHFVEDRNPEFVRANITDVALRQLDVNVLLIVDAHNNVVLARDIQLQSEQPLGLDLAALTALPENFPWRASLLGGHSVKGLLMTNRGVMLLAASPILDGNGKGPARGMVLMGRLLNEVTVAEIAAQAQAELTMLPAMPALQRRTARGDRCADAGLSALQRSIWPADHRLPRGRAARGQPARQGGDPGRRAQPVRRRGAGAGPAGGGPQQGHSRSAGAHHAACGGARGGR